MWQIIAKDRIADLHATIDRQRDALDEATRRAIDMHAAIRSLKHTLTCIGGPACPGDGCDCCGGFLADVVVPADKPGRRGATFCWPCVDHDGLTGWLVLPGRQRRG